MKRQSIKSLKGVQRESREGPGRVRRVSRESRMGPERVKRGSRESQENVS